MHSKLSNNSSDLSASPALEQLAELVRQAEAKTRARKIEAETQHAAEVFRAAEVKASDAVERARVRRAACLRALEKADSDEHLLKDLVRKLTMFKSSLKSESDAEHLITSSRAEIEQSRKQSRIELDDITRQLDEARRELRSAIDHYRPLRRELDRLQPELSEQFSADDALLWEAEAHFPGGQLQLLGQEVEAGFHSFGSLCKQEQYARLKVWIGRFRYHQATHDKDTESSEELVALSHRIFHQLKWLSRQFEPGYIEAFRQDFSTDWGTYVEDAQEQLFHVLEGVRRTRDLDPARAGGLAGGGGSGGGIHLAARDVSTSGGQNGSSVVSPADGLELLRRRPLDDDDIDDDHDHDDHGHDHDLDDVLDDDHGDD